MKAITKNYDLVTGIITSDFQIRIRFGWMGFENEFWDRTNENQLLYPNKRVDVHHNQFPSAFLMKIDFHICQDYKRKQADWTKKKAMNAVIATFLVPHNSQAKSKINSLYSKGQIGISIEHGGRKPKRTIGPLVTLCDRPQNQDAWIVCGNIDGKNYRNIYPDDLHLPDSILKLCRKQFSQVKRVISKMENSK